LGRHQRNKKDDASAWVKTPTQYWWWRQRKGKDASTMWVTTPANNGANPSAMQARTPAQHRQRRQLCKDNVSQAALPVGRSQRN
jgi:hypothetical protein